MHWFWQHRYEPTGVREMVKHVYVYSVRIGNGEPTTEVLYRCACGATKTKTLTGHWTLAEVKGS